MNILTYAKKNEIVKVNFDHEGQAVFARRLEDGRWDIKQVQYQPESQELAQDIWRVDAPELFHPLSGEKLIAVRGSNSFRAFIEAGTPAEALTSFESVIPRHYRGRDAEKREFVEA